MKFFFRRLKDLFKKIAEFILKSKDDANSSVHESLFHKQKNKVRLNIKIQD